MTISAISSSSVSTQAIRPQAELGEAQRAGRDAKNDGDSDDGGVSAAKAPAPTVNLMGQLIGTRINVTA